MLFIGITTHTNDFTQLTEGERIYIDVLQHINMTPVLLTNTADFVETEEQLSRVDALVLIGGGDVHPSRYGRIAMPDVEYKDVSKARDLCELQLARRANQMDMPTLGICRGSQVMNVSMGGTLHGDIQACGVTPNQHQQEKPYSDCHQTVHIQPETQLFDLLFGAEQRHISDIDWVINTNSMHHQAIEHPAEGLYINAITTDGVYEGVEDPSKRFFVGVQWHPEYLSNCMPIFEGLRDACQHP